MDAIKFLAEFKRMCKTYQGCAGCCAIENCNYMGMESDAQRQELVVIVKRWSKDHPQKTRLQDFLEKYPNAKKFDDGVPIACCSILGYCKGCDESGSDCTKCWNMPMEE